MLKAAGLSRSTYYYEISKKDKVQERNSALSAEISAIFAENKGRKWTTDVSQFNLPWGKCYLSPILDMNTNEIVSYNLSLSPNLEQIKDMLVKAFQRFPSVQGLIMHSDQGWQYQHEFYRNELAKHGVIQSMSRKGNCFQNQLGPIPAEPDGRTKVRVPMLSSA